MNIFSITYTAQKAVPQGVMVETGSAIILANDNDAAIGIAYSMAKMRFPASRGYYNHGAGCAMATPEEIQMIREFLK